MGVARGAPENKHILFVNPIAILLLLAYVQFLELVNQDMGFPQLASDRT